MRRPPCVDHHAQPAAYHVAITVPEAHGHLHVTARNALPPPQQLRLAGFRKHRGWTHRHRPWAPRVGLPRPHARQRVCSGRSGGIGDPHAAVLLPRHADVQPRAALHHRQRRPWDRVAMTVMLHDADAALLACAKVHTKRLHAATHRLPRPRPHTAPRSGMGTPPPPRTCHRRAPARVAGRAATRWPARHRPA